MTTKVILGAPSLSGKDANDTITAAFSDAVFPLTLVVASLMPMPSVFPEIGVSLRSVAASEGSSKTVAVANLDALQRFASSVEQVAELNKFAEAITLETVDSNESGSSKKASGKKAAQASETATS